MEELSEIQNLLLEFCEGRNREESFRGIADRLSGLIYHSALRQGRDAAVAEDVPQCILLLISRKAAKLARHPRILAWVHEATRLEVKQMMRSERLRKKREENAIMKSENTEANFALLEELDHSLSRLSEAERELVLMRFFEGRAFPAIAARTGRSESAEKMRLKRALEKMAGWFGKKGVTLSVAGLTAVLSTEMAKGAPVGLATVVSVGAVGAGSGKLAGGVALLVAAGFVVPVLAEWREVRELEERVLSLRGSEVELSKRKVGEDLVLSRRRFGEMLYDPTSEEMNLPVAELAWRYRKAEEINDDLTMDRIELVLETLGLDELREFALEFRGGNPAPVSNGLLSILKRQMTASEQIDFLIQMGASDNRVASRFRSEFGDRLEEAAEILFEKDESGILEPMATRRNYRTNLWYEFLKMLQGATLGEGKVPSAKELALVEEGILRAPMMVRPSFEKLQSKLRVNAKKKEGGKR